MPWLVALFALLLPLNVLAAGRLVISSDRAVVVIVNRVPHTMSAGGKISIDISDGKEGYQYVKVVSLFGEQRYDGKVSVPRGTVVVAAWEGRDFTVQSQRPLGGSRGVPTRVRSGGPPVPPPSEGLPSDVYELVIREVQEYEQRAGKRVEPPRK